MHPYAEQHPEDLLLSYIDGPFDPNTLTVYKQQKYAFFNGMLDVTASIIGASHVLSFTVGGREFHEVFACCEIPDTPCYKLSELTSPIFENLPKVGYRFRTHTIPWPDASLQPRELDELVYQANKSFGLICEFESGKQGVTPITVITGYEKYNRLIIKTGHAYPGDALVITSTRLQPYEGR